MTAEIAPATGLTTPPVPVSLATPAALPHVERDGSCTVLTFRGRYRPGIDRWEYLQFPVPAGVSRITVAAWYERFRVIRGVAGNVLDLGLFGPAGWDVHNAAGFRGWSGGARTGFTVSAHDATPGYLAGPIEPGTWAVALGPVVLNPIGMRWRVRVTLESDAPAPLPVPLPRAATPPVPVRGPGWYRGDLHLHTVHSDGQWTLDTMAGAARDAGLDFVASTDHNTSAANRAWAARCPDGTLVLPAEEVTTRHGHWLALGLVPDGWVDWRYAPRDGHFADCAERVRAGGGLVVAAHPALPLPGGAWEFGFRHVDAVEVWNGAWSLDDEASLRIWHRLLRRGRRITGVGGSDSHAVHQPVGHPQTVVLAGSATPGALVDGLRRGRAYIAESSAVTLEVGARVEGGTAAGPGDTLPVPHGAPVEVSATVTGAPGTTITIITAAGPVARASVDATGTHRLCWRTTVAARFVRVEVRRRTRRLRRPMVALSNPVWLRAGPVVIA